MRIKSKKTGKKSKIPNSQWDSMPIYERLKYEIIDHSELFDPYTCVSDLDISGIQSFVQFIGSVRSGHTLVSQIINSHKDALISDELGVTSLFDNGIDLTSLLHAINIRADKYYNGGSKTWVNRYDIGYYQNKTESPIIIGDKICGTDTSKFIDQNYLKRYMGFIGLPFKFIWVLREPIQHINGKVALGVKAKNKNYSTIEQNIKQYKLQYKSAKAIEKKHDVLRVYLENLISNPSDEIKRIINFVGLDIDDNHISECEKIIFDKPHTHDVKWSDKQIAMLNNEIKDYYEYVENKCV